jgi:hypothetical protein
MMSCYCRELKKLARVWKLNEERNFWKNHSERHEMVTALLEYANSSQSFRGKNILPNTVSPLPPTENKSTIKYSSREQKTNLRNYCGLKVYFVIFKF